MVRADVDGRAIIPAADFDWHEVWKLAVSGASLREIAAYAQVTEQTAAKYRETALGLWHAERHAEREYLRAVHHERMEGVYRELVARLPKATTPKDAASLATAIGKVLADQRKMWGVDAPNQLQVNMLGAIQTEQRHALLSDDESRRLATILVQRVGEAIANGEESPLALPGGAGGADQPGGVATGAAPVALGLDPHADHGEQAGGEEHQDDGVRAPAARQE